MSFITRLQVLEPFDTWPGMEIAADERYWDGLALALSDPSRVTGAIYLLGYVAEMLLKTACFRFISTPRSDDLWAKPGPFQSLQAYARWNGRNRHDLRGWLQQLIDVRIAAYKPLDPIFAGQAWVRVILIDSHWREWLRYRHANATESDLHEVLDGVEWIMQNRSLLWS